VRIFQCEKKTRPIGVEHATNIAAAWTKVHWRETSENIPVAVQD
jgi:hypothetical protein